MTASVDPAALRAARQNRGMTQHQLARLLDVAGGEAVARWERGASEPRPATLRRLADLLNIAPGDLLQLDGGNIDLRYLRLAAGLASSAVAAQLHVTPNTYLRWERGAWTAMPGEAVVAGLSKAFHVAPEILTRALAHTRALGSRLPE